MDKEELILYKEACSCQNCVLDCSHKPGWFLPEEIERAAELLNLSVEEFFQNYLSVDIRTEGKDIPEDSFVLAPASSTNAPGKITTIMPFGICIFLQEDGKCGIHEAKPFEYRAVHHNDPKGFNQKRKIFIAKEWLKHKEFLKKLLGHDLFVPWREEINF